MAVAAGKLVPVLPRILALPFVLALARGAPAQVPVQGTVTAAETGAPLAGAVVTAIRSRTAAETDRLGRFRLWVHDFPDTVVVTFLGRERATVPLGQLPSAPIVVAMVAAPVPLSAIAVLAPGRGRGTLALGRSRLSANEIRAVAPAVEADVFRALALAPSVSFTTPLSARPLIRGYEANQASFRIDGHEVVNLYHIGRVFSAFPANAVKEVDLRAAPAGVSDGGAVAGIVDVGGRDGATGGLDGGLDVSLASATTWLGGGGRIRGFGAARVVHFGLIGAIADQDVPYGFEDFYGSVAIGAASRPRARVTVFLSRDRLTDASPGTSMRWSNGLVGAQTQLVERPTWGLSLRASAARFTEDASRIRARHSRLDVRNHFSRFTNELKLTVYRPTAQLVVGGALGRRGIANRITPISGQEFDSADVNSRQVEGAMFAEWEQQFGPVSGQLGIRLDAAGPVRILQPRLRIHVPLSAAVSLAFGGGRMGQTYHLVSDPRSEPELWFYDFWLSASDSGVGPAIADHALVDLDVRKGALGARLSAFGSRSSGLFELRPVSDPARRGDGQFRKGGGRTAGLELQVGVGGTDTRASSLSGAYVVGWSQRNWGEGWVPWSEDRRHTLRLFGQVALGAAWNVFGGFEATSGAPLTLVEQVFFLGAPPAVPDVPSYIYGPENSARSAGTARLDIGARWRFRGPWSSQAALGLSVLNIAFGPVAPLVPASPEGAPLPDRPGTLVVGYERLFSLPPIPTVTFRLEF